MYDARKQIICTAPCLPSDIKGISERLLSRLQSGFIADIAAPDIPTKIAIIELKARLHNTKVAPEVIEAIAAQAGRNVRDIEGLLIRVLAFASLTKQALSVELVNKVLSRVELAAVDKVQKPDFQRIISKVANYYQCSLEELRSSKRQKQIALVRHVAMYLMKRLTDKSLADIASFFKRKDHTTVIHAVSKIEAQKKTNTELMHQIDTIERSIG